MKSLAFAVLFMALAVPAMAADMGEQVYRQACAMCHNRGIGGAPAIDDKEAWKGRLVKGEQTLIANAINGFRGEKGFMPPRGGRANLTDEQVSAAVRYLLTKNR